MSKKSGIVYAIRSELEKNWQLYLLLILPVAYVIVFSYVPMAGLQIAFKDFRLNKSMWITPIHPEGPFYYFKRFIDDFNFTTIMKNTIILSVYQLIVSSVAPVFLALVLNSLVSNRFRKTVQLVTYAPHFISIVVMVGILMQILSLRSGPINNVVELLGYERVNFMAKAGLFRHLYVWSGVWQETGYSSIIYLAALAGIDPQLHEAARVDGASKFKSIIHIDIPGILPTFIILLIMHVGKVLSLGYTKAFLFQNLMNIGVSQIIDTYVYNVGLGASVPGVASQTMPNFSYATAIGMFQSIIGLILVLIVNRISAKVSETSLW